MKTSSDATAALLSFALYHVMMLPHVQASDVVRGHRDMLSSLSHHRHLDDGPCGVQEAGFVSCFLENESCTSSGFMFGDGDDGSGRNRRLEETITSCEEYELGICVYNLLLPECPCIDEYQAQLECQAEQAGLTCESSPDCDDPIPSGEGPCGDEEAGLGLCFLENCLSSGPIFGDGDDGSGRNRRLEETITSCEEYELNICVYDLIFPECPCIDEYQAQLECQAEQAGLTCESSPDCDDPIPSGEGPCGDEEAGLGFCFLENCLGSGPIFGDGDDGSSRNRRLEETITSCEEYELGICVYDLIFPECPCIDEYQAQLECQAEQAGLTCESSPECDNLCTALFYEVNLCVMEDDNCLGVFDDVGSSSGVDDGAGEDSAGAFASCEDYNEALNSFDADFSGCKCDVKAAAACVAKQEGLICDSSTPPPTPVEVVAETTKSPVTPAPVDDAPPSTPDEVLAEPTKSPVTPAPVDDAPPPTPDEVLAEPTKSPVTAAPVDDSPPPTPVEVVAEPTKSPVTPAPVDDSPPPTPSAGTSLQKNVLLISFMSMVMSAVVPFSAIFM